MHPLTIIRARTRVRGPIPVREPAHGRAGAQTINRRASNATTRRGHAVTNARAPTKAPEEEEAHHAGEEARGEEAAGDVRERESSGKIASRSVLEANKRT